MNEEDHIINDSAVTEIRQALAASQWALALANGHVKAQAQHIAELNRQLEATQAPTVPQYSPGGAVPPKPGPR